MTTAEMPTASKPSDGEPGTNDELDRKVYQRRQHRGRSDAEHALPENLQQTAETSAAEEFTYHSDTGSQSTSADTTSSDCRPSQKSRSSGLFGVIAGAVDLFLPSKARQKDERSADRQRRPPTPRAPEPTGRLQDHAKHKVNRPQEQTPSERSLESRRLHEEKAKQEAAALRDQLQRLQIKAKQDEHKLRQLATHAENMENMVCTLRDDLGKANIRVAALGRTVAENELIITQANATAVSRLASDVSRGFTDDMIREALKKFFQTDFFSWCADLCAERIEDEDAAAAHHKLLEAGILNSNANHLNGPTYLRFNLDMPDGSSPLLLLQAALATRLCVLYLSDAYFLAEELPINHKGRLELFHLEQHFGQAQPDAAISWRIQTVECLENAVPITEGYVQREVDRFMEEYSFLLSVDRSDSEARKDLVQIFVDFATLAIKLWKTRAGVMWYSTMSFREVPFELGSPWVEVESSLVSTMGQRLNGRPIGLIIRPTISSKSLSKDGQWEEVIWLKALAWVSGEDEPMELMESS
ncbi:hypothetical protein J3F83DRAFT_737734 [Trichoderma novae-zelandiae]